MELKSLIKAIRAKIEREYDEIQELIEQAGVFREVDNFLTSPDYSDLEKAFYLLLNQHLRGHKDYIVIPREMVLVPDVYDMSAPGIEYEIDFALYGGSIHDPVKVAIECDGLRSHGEKHKNKDRRKDINLQSAGWIVMRFGSKEIHNELHEYASNENYSSNFLFSIENVIDQKLKLITSNSFFRNYHGLLTGYKFGDVMCPTCGFVQNDRLNHKRITCRKCKCKFLREIGNDEKMWYEYNGIIFFKD